jgi:hypothetical protein
MKEEQKTNEKKEEDSNNCSLLDKNSEIEKKNKYLE